ncbi:MAG: protein kinase [Opitutaceae bacterium]|nr:protein kinase [Opitutaceae bacterium]
MSLPPPPTTAQLAVAFPEVVNPQQIAVGGFKYVYRATVNGAIEAFKLLALPAVGVTEAEKAARQEYIGRAQREVELLGKCAAPELVKLGSLAPREVNIGGLDFLGYSEEFLAGEGLHQYIQRKGPPPTEREAKMLFLSLLRAIKQLWQFETVHRDIKPLNVVMLGSAGRPFVLLDLGIAYQTREPGLTVDPAIRPATLPYMAPEMLQANFRQALDYRADIYTAGITTFEYATFVHPLQYQPEHPAKTLSRVLRQSPTPLRSLRADYSEAFCRLIDQTLKKSPPLRPGNLDAIIKRLEAEV